MTQGGEVTTERWHVCCHGCAYEELVESEGNALAERDSHREASGHRVSAQRVDSEA